MFLRRRLIREGKTGFPPEFIPRKPAISVRYALKAPRGDFDSTRSGDARGGRLVRKLLEAVRR
jgi:hypothetical protein